MDQRSAAESLAPGFSLTLLGTPVVRRIEPGGVEVELVWRLRRALQIVAFLALAPDQRAGKEELIEAIWPEANVEAISRNFHPTLSDARRTLAGGDRRRRDVIVFRQGIYALNPEIRWEVDVLRFEQLIATGREQLAQAEQGESTLEAALESWMAAWRLYRGPLLVESELPWITTRRDDLRRAYLALLADVGRLSARLSQVTEALDAYRSVLIEEPYEERIHMAVMELYAQQGRRDLVRRQYMRLQDLLQELDVEPLEEVQKCYHRLMR